MNTEVNSLLQNLKIEKIRSQEQQTARPAEKAVPGEFEALLKKVSKGMEALKGETREGTDRLDEQELDQPEALKEAVKDAGRKYQSHAKLSQNLIEAYKATIDAVKK